MKKLYILFFLTIGFLGNAQIVNIPDATFKTKLLAASPSNTIAKNLLGAYFKIDSNNDGQIQVSEASQVLSIDLTTYSGAASSLEGITNFTNLETLNCNGQVLTTLDLQGLTSLKYLDCAYNDLTSLNVQGLINLETFITMFASSIPATDGAGNFE